MKIITTIKNNKYMRITTTILAILIALYCMKIELELIMGLIGSLFLYAFTQRADVFLLALGIFILLFAFIASLVIYIIIINTKEE